MKRTTVILLLLATTTILSACGGGGGGSTPAATTATIKISTQGTFPLGTLIGGINVTLVLPAGVTVKATPDPVNTSVLVTDSGVVISSGVAVSNSTILATYSAATSSVAGTVNIQIANPNGFVKGEFVTVSAGIATGNPTASNFSLPSFAAVDLNGTPLGALTATLVATIQ